MNLAARVGLGAGLAGGLLIAAVVATSTGALPDNTGPARIASLTGYCPNDDDSPCILEVVRVRPLTTTAAAEAEAAGIEPTPLRERTVRRQVVRATLRQFLLNNTTPAP